MANPHYPKVPESAKPKVSFTDTQLQSKYNDHALAFGISGPWNKANGAAFRDAIEAHVADPSTQHVSGTFHQIEVMHHVNPSTGLNVITSPEGEFISGWVLNEKQLWNELNRGSV
jgi:hypothetical protein